MMKTNQLNSAYSTYSMHRFKISFAAFAMLSSLMLSCFFARAQTTGTKSTPEEMVGALHAAFGQHPHARAVHAKGLFFSGTFTPAASAKSLSVAPHLQSQATSVIVRFSDFTGIPDIADTLGASNPRGFAIKFDLGNGRSSDIIAHSFNGFPVATTDEFREFLLDISKSGPEAPHPNPIEQFLNVHPIAKTFVTTQKQPSVSYGTLSYFGVNSFKMTNKKGHISYIRYQIIPEAGEQFLTAAEVKNAGPDYLAGEIRERVAKGPVNFKLYAQLAVAGDHIKDPSIAWPDRRKLVLLGVISIQKLADNTLEADKALIFNPGNLPDGISIADPMVADRAKLYPVSVRERQQ